MADTDSYSMIALGDYRFGLSTAAPEEMELASNRHYVQAHRQLAGAKFAVSALLPGEYRRARG